MLFAAVRAVAGHFWAIENSSAMLRSLSPINAFRNKNAPGSEAVFAWRFWLIWLAAAVVTMVALHLYFERRMEKLDERIELISRGH